MSEEYSKAPHQETGDFLKRTREKKGLSRYNVAKQAGWERIDLQQHRHVIALSENNGYIHLFLREK